MSIRTVFTRIRHAIFGKPVSHEEARAAREAMTAAQRGSGGEFARDRGKSVQTQTSMF